MSRRTLTLGLALLGLALALATVTIDGDGDGDGGEAAVAAALAEGNRLFRAGRLEQAVAAYRGGWSGGGRTGAAEALLAYNLAATLHALDRLPEAVLWYRRAGTGDPWCEENLALARAELGAAGFPPGGVAGRLAVHADALAAAGAGLAWLAAALFAFGSRPPRWLAPALAAAALVVWGTVLGVRYAAPAPAVLLAPCVGPGGELPAGSEVWASATDDGRWTVAGAADGLLCPADTVALVR